MEVITQEIDPKKGKSELKYVKRRRLFSCQRGQFDVIDDRPSHGSVALLPLTLLYIRELLLSIFLPSTVLQYNNSVILPQKPPCSLMSGSSVITPQQVINYTIIMNLSPAVWNAWLALWPLIKDHTPNISM